MCATTHKLKTLLRASTGFVEIQQWTVWLSVFGIQESDLIPSSRVCSRHFPEGDVKKSPSMILGK